MAITSSVSLCWLLRSFVSGPRKVSPGHPVMLRIPLVSIRPERMLVSLARSRTICSIDRLLIIGMLFTFWPASAVISNCILSETSSGGCTRGVAWTFSPKSTYSEAG